MDCFGETRKIPTLCSDSLNSLTTRIAITNSPTEILITESANLATKYDIEQYKSIQSLSFNELNKLLLPLSSYYSAKRGLEILIGVHSGNTLFEWSYESNELKPECKKHFQTAISAILSTKYGPIIVFSNGFAELLHKLKNDFDEEKVSAIIEPNEQIIGIEYHCFSKSNIALYYIVRPKDNDKLVVYKLILSSSKCSLN